MPRTLLLGAALALLPTAGARADIITLDPDGSTHTQASGVSGGNVVGQYRVGSGPYHGFLYNGSTYTTLDPPGSTFTKPTSVTGGNVVGYYTAGGAQHGFLYNGSTYTTLDPPGSISTLANGVS